jgi:hypothetical protein
MTKTQGKTAKPSSRSQTLPKPASNNTATQLQPRSRMPRLCAASENLRDQIRVRGGCDVINLSAMYRADAQPQGKDPWSWAREVTPVIAAIHRYKSGHDPNRLRLEPVRDLIACDDGEMDEFNYPGDCETRHVEIAALYALYLDVRLLMKALPQSA